MASPIVDAAVEQNERRMAAFAMASVLICSPFGTLAGLWWANRHNSLHVWRYAITALAIDAAIFLEGIVMVPVALFAPEAVSGPAFIALWLFQLFLIVTALVLAVRAWRGVDVGGRLVPAAFIDRLPSRTAP